jgi:hypothetical protein
MAGKPMGELCHLLQGREGCLCALARHHSYFFLRRFR